MSSCLNDVVVYEYTCSKVAVVNVVDEVSSLNVWGWFCNTFDVYHYGNLIFLVVYFEVLSITSCVWNSRYFEAMVWLQQCGMVCVFKKHNLCWLKLARNFLGDRRHILHLFFFFTFEYWWISRTWVEEEKLPVKISAERHAGLVVVTHDRRPNTLLSKQECLWHRHLIHSNPPLLTRSGH